MIDGVDTEIEMHVDTSKLENAVATIVWAGEDEPYPQSSSPMPLIRKATNNNAQTVTFGTTSAGIAKITVTVTDIENNTFTSYRIITVSELDPIDNLFLRPKPNGGMALGGTTDYNHPLATLSMYFSYAAYNPIPPGIITQLVAPAPFMDTTDKLKDVLRGNDHGFKDIIQPHYWNLLVPGVVGFTLAHKDIQIGNETKSLVVVVVRGSTPDVDWITNFISLISVGDTSLGFGMASSVARWELDAYIALQQSLNHIKKDPIVWITGHSLGGAVANLLAYDLNNTGWGQERVYAYTFASPTVVDENKAGPDANIFNILNQCGSNGHSFGGLIANACCDFVTHIPSLARRDLFGISILQKRHGLEAHIDMVPENAKEPSWAPIDFGNIAINHKMPTYLGWLDALPDETSWANIMSYDTCPPNTH